jgi:hypothetical protein
MKTYKDNYEILWSRVLLEKLIVAQSRNSLFLIEPEGSLLCLLKSASGPCPKPDESSPHTRTVFLQEIRPPRLLLQDTAPRSGETR